MFVVRCRAFGRSIAIGFWRRAHVLARPPAFPPEEKDMVRIALAQLELAKSDVAIGERSAAAAHYRAAIKVLRKRRSTLCLGALPGARRELAAVLKPNRRLRGKTLPEDC